jgi:uncharacterized protein (DUF1778 family)
MGSAATKKKQTEEKADIRRVNLSFTAEEYELLERAAAADVRNPTAMAKVLVMKGLEGISK